MYIRRLIREMIRFVLGKFVFNKRNPKEASDGKGRKDELVERIRKLSSKRTEGNVRRRVGWQADAL